MPGGGVLPIMANTGRLHPKEAPYFKLHLYDRVGISRVELYLRVGRDLSSRSLKRAKSSQMHFMAVKKVKKAFCFSDLFIFSKRPWAGYLNQV